ncbi:MAG: hypothetical protein DHS20C13_07100 [Thermodesulfobacteriota bacterium]|nr:MAG: hypothetical protein DHS20C13_07100 [Thermodesulfobacteriota bacterium]
MFKIKSIFVFFLFLLLLVPVQSAFSQYACIPTCDTDDGQFLVLAGIGLSTSNNRDAEFQIVSGAESEFFELGIFDGDGTFTNWDINNAPTFVVLDVLLFADPEGNGTGNSELIARWSSNGTFGSNIGDPMPNDDWFIRTLPNSELARTEDGTFSYRLVMINTNPGALGLNGFKVRSDGVMAIPAGAAFNYSATPRAPEDFETLFPNVDITDPACADINRPGIFCDPLTDPSCCLNPSFYTGMWRFCFVAPEGLNTLNIWDGDFDYGSASFDADFNCIKPDNVALDTDDPNTPVPLPEWALNTDAITQSASVPTEPADDNGCNPLSNLPPSVNYNLVGPGGVSYTNVNPSGNIEWELFNISTNPFNPSLYDIEVDSIPGGLWCVETFGNDMQNLNSFRLPFTVFGVDDTGEPVLGPTPPSPIPVFNAWGLFLLVALITGAAVYSIRKKKIFS